MTTYKDNRSFVRRGIDDVVYEEKPIPRGTFRSPVADDLDSDLGAFSLQSESTRSSSRSERLLCRPVDPELYSRTDPCLPKASVALMSAGL